MSETLGQAPASLQPYKRRDLENEWIDEHVFIAQIHCVLHDSFTEPKPDLNT